MVEGHQVHRVAVLHAKKLLQKKFKATSPNGRFTEGAKLIDNQPLRRVEAVGKNLFYFFGKSHVVHVHFGMSGQFKLEDPPGSAPSKNTRLRLEHKDVVGHLSAMTLKHGGVDLFETKRATLGPDPLRADADPERLWTGLRKAKKSIGEVLMDQALVAGIGNIWRAEILFLARVHPGLAAMNITRPQFESLWSTSVTLLKKGFQTGSVVTVTEEEAAKGLRRYVYNQSHCGRCQAGVRSYPDKNKRTVYFCPVCQKMPGISTPASAPVRVFNSRCTKAPELNPDGLPPIAKMTKAAMAEELEARGADPRGSKAVLAQRLNQVRAVPLPKSGTADVIEGMTTPAEAAKEKLLAGEGRNVEHVAEFDEETRRLLENASASRKRKAGRRESKQGGEGVQQPAEPQPKRRRQSQRVVQRSKR
eukprot:CAMPEP_0119145214 /NCGR_PEP_ID=MMETSP1310-20130426/37184_1 /TAXON_ID=464262 /ORGANISM="Genus nov. species nov., Strain RCC2339" /LENGTH=417 /DNA_ID=CAMNT_0007137013 /DNA_START=201 /DNA_END=1454 /DNA_ORIENTATION=+